MRKVIQVGRKSKREDREALRMAEQIDSRVELIQALIPLGLDAVKDLLQKEVKALAGERYRRGGGPPDGCVGGDRGDRSIWQTRSYRSRFPGFGIAMRGWKYPC